MGVNEQTDQMMIEVYANAMIHGTGFLKLAMTPQGLEWTVVKPEDYQWLEPNEAAKEAQGRVYDLLLADDGQAWKEARRYLQRARPDLWMRLEAKK